MDIISTIILAIGLSMDSTVIALTSGAIIKNHQPVNVLKIAGMLAFMQMMLTIIGWLLGATVVDYINQYDHWIAFAILSLLGGKMIIDGLRNRHNEEVKRTFNPLNIKTMFSLSFATSIDALAVGLSLSLINFPITMPAIIVGSVTFILASIGVISGCKAGNKSHLKVSLIGGAMLLFIGATILAEHTILSSEELFAFL